MERMPTIGMRMVKTFVAVCLCMYLNALLWNDDLPFYSAIAAVLCMQPDVPNSIKVALNRTWGTLIGGLSGMAILLLERGLLPTGGGPFAYLIEAFCVIPLIYITLLFKKPAAAYITCVVFFSVTISHSGDASPFLFAINRMLDTLLGIFVSLGVNALPPLRKRRRDLLVIASLEGVLLNNQNQLDNATRFKLNDLRRKGAAIAFSTKQTPAETAPLLSGTGPALPVLVLDGAALYDLETETFLHTSPIPPTAAEQVRELLIRCGLNGFYAYVIEDDLYIYHPALSGPAEQEYHEALRRYPRQHSLLAELPAGRDALHIAAFAPAAQADRLAAALAALADARLLRIYRREPAAGSQSAVRFDIYSAETVFTRAIADLKATAGAKTVALIGACNDELMQAEAADEKYAIPAGEAYSGLQEMQVLSASSPRAVIRAIDRLFHYRRSGRAVAPAAKTTPADSERS